MRSHFYSQPSIQCVLYVLPNYFNGADKLPLLAGTRQSCMWKLFSSVFLPQISINLLVSPLINRYACTCTLTSRLRELIYLRKIASLGIIIERNSVDHPSWVDHTTGRVRNRAAHLPTDEREPTTRGIYLIISSYDQRTTCSVFIRAQRATQRKIELGTNSSHLGLPSSDLHGPFHSTMDYHVHLSRDHAVQ
jgi:hypothetical protein